MTSFNLSRFYNAESVRILRPGILVALALGVVSVYVSRGLGGIFAQSPLLVAIIVGLLIGSSFGTPAALDPGLTYVVKKVLRLSVALVGFRITLQQVAEIGIVPFLIAAAVLTATFIFTFWMSRRFLGVEDEMAYLLAAGCSVCGASAILAVAALVKPQARQTTVGITLITLLGTVSLLTYPLVYAAGLFPGLSDHTYGVFIGATVYEVAQVVGAGYSVSEVAGTTAVVIKLSKVIMLIPLLIILGLRMRRQNPDQEQNAPLVPWFVVAFLLLLIINTLNVVPTNIVGAINQTNLFLLTAVMVALGLRTPIGRLSSLRWAMQPSIAAIIVFITGALFGYGLVLAATPVLGSGMTPTGSAYGQYGGVQSQDPQIIAGEEIFFDIGCAKCHVPTMPTADGQPVHLYSDLLLHDMGPALDDKIVQGSATGGEWRTAPLWGVGQRTRYLHDGRATSIHDAIVAHGGEAEIVTARYQALSSAEVDALLSFVRTR